jgi:hypothetical protein
LQDRKGETGLMQLEGLTPTKRFRSPVSLSESYCFLSRYELKAKRYASSLGTLQL